MPPPPVDVDAHHGPMIGLAAGAALIPGGGTSALELWGGGLLTPRLAVVGGVLWSTVEVEDGYTDQRLLSGGLRAWFSARSFVDLRGGWMRSHHSECGPSALPCVRTGPAGEVALGVELLRGRGAGLELRGALAISDHDGTAFVSLGVSVY